MEKLDYLIEYLLKENTEVRIDKMPTDINDKKNLYRSLCNIREPKSISKEYLEIENKYLQEELQKKNVTKVEDIKPVSQTIKEICLWKGDITTLEIDSIVNAANSQGLGCFRPLHNCIDNQIQTFSGVQMRIECDKYMKTIDYNLPTGKAFITKGYNLPTKYVIHTVGPIINNKVTEKEKAQLANCYTSSLELAVDYGIRTIAFPCISTGEFRFPKDEACKLAILAVENFLKEHREDFDKIIFNVYGEEDFAIYDKFIKEGK